eukprot:1550308-Rhodomonas_salina.1
MWSFSYANIACGWQVDGWKAENRKMQREIADMQSSVTSSSSIPAQLTMSMSSQGPDRSSAGAEMQQQVMQAAEAARQQQQQMSALQTASEAVTQMQQEVLQPAKDFLTTLLDDLSSIPSKTKTLIEGVSSTLALKKTNPMNLPWIAVGDITAMTKAVFVLAFLNIADDDYVTKIWFRELLPNKTSDLATKIKSFMDAQDGLAGEELPSWDLRTATEKESYNMSLVIPIDDSKDAYLNKSNPSIWLARSIYVYRCQEYNAAVTPMLPQVSKMDTDRIKPFLEHCASEILRSVEEEGWRIETSEATYTRQYYPIVVEDDGNLSRDTKSVYSCCDYRYMICGMDCLTTGKVLHPDTDELHEQKCLDQRSYSIYIAPKGPHPAAYQLLACPAERGRMQSHISHLSQDAVSQPPYLVPLQRKNAGQVFPTEEPLEVLRQVPHLPESSDGLYAHLSNGNWTNQQRDKDDRALVSFHRYVDPEKYAEPYVYVFTTTKLKVGGSFVEHYTVGEQTMKTGGDYVSQKFQHEASEAEADKGYRDWAGQHASSKNGAYSVAFVDREGKALITGLPNHLAELKVAKISLRQAMELDPKPDLLYVEDYPEDGCLDPASGVSYNVLDSVYCYLYGGKAKSKAMDSYPISDVQYVLAYPMIGTQLLVQPPLALSEPRLKSIINGQVFCLSKEEVLRLRTTMTYRGDMYVSDLRLLDPTFPATYNLNFMDACRAFHHRIRYDFLVRMVKTYLDNAGACTKIRNYFEARGSLIAFNWLITVAMQIEEHLLLRCSGASGPAGGSGFRKDNKTPEVILDIIKNLPDGLKVIKNLCAGSAERTVFDLADIQAVCQQYSINKPGFHRDRDLSQPCRDRIARWFEFEHNVRSCSVYEYLVNISCFTTLALSESDIAPTQDTPDRKFKLHSLERRIEADLENVWAIRADVEMNNIYVRTYEETVKFVLLEKDKVGQLAAMRCQGRVRPTDLTYQGPVHEHGNKVADVVGSILYRHTTNTKTVRMSYIEDGQYPCFDVVDNQEVPQQALEAAGWASRETVTRGSDWYLPPQRKSITFATLPREKPLVSADSDAMNIKTLWLVTTSNKGVEKKSVKLKELIEGDGDKFRKRVEEIEKEQAKVNSKKEEDVTFYLVCLDVEEVHATAKEGSLDYAIISYRWATVQHVVGDLCPAFKAMNEDLFGNNAHNGKIDCWLSLDSLVYDQLSNCSGGVLVDCLNHLDIEQRLTGALSDMAKNYAVIPVLPIFLGFSDLRRAIHRGWILQEVFGTKYHPAAQRMSPQGLAELRKITGYKGTDMKRETDRDKWALKLVNALEQSEYSGQEDRYIAPVARLRGDLVSQLRALPPYKKAPDERTEKARTKKIQVSQVLANAIAAVAFKDDKDEGRRAKLAAEYGKAEREIVTTIIDIHAVAPQYLDAVCPYLLFRLVPTTMPSGLCNYGLGGVKQNRAVATSFNTYRVVAGLNFVAVLQDSTLVGDSPDHSEESFKRGDLIHGCGQGHSLPSASTAFIEDCEEERQEGGGTGESKEEDNGGASE